MNWQHVYDGVRSVSKVALVALALVAAISGAVNILYGIPTVYKRVVRLQAEVRSINAACATIQKDQGRIK